MLKEKLLTIAFVCAFSLMLLTNANATPINLDASEDTWVTMHPNWGPDSNHGAETTLLAVRGAGNSAQSYPIVKFDLTSLTGATVLGPTVDFQITLFDTWPNPRTQNLELFTIVTDWSEMTATWNNFGGTGFDINNTNQIGQSLGSQNVTFSKGQAPLDVVFTIDSAVVQGWIDDVNTNNGLLLYSNTPVNYTDFVFYSRERDNQRGPKLGFEANIVPEPGTMFLLGSALIGMIGFKKKA